MTNTYNHIQNLVDEKIIKRELKGYRPEFAMTFVFPTEHKEAIHEYVAEKGKKHIVDMIIQKAVEYDGR
jgi:hypothetical protein